MKKLFFLLFSFVLVFSTSLNIYAKSTPIRDKARSTPSQAVQFLKDHNAEQELIDLVPFIYEYCEEVGVEPTLVVAQISLETNYFKSCLCKSHKNTSGIKKTHTTYRKYDTYKDGIKAEIDLLNKYAGSNPDDKSFNSGWCTTVEGLAGKWAEDPNYSRKLLSIMSDIQSYQDCNFYDDSTKQDEEKSSKSPSKDTRKTPVSIIKDILNKNKQHSKGYDAIMKYLK